VEDAIAFGAALETAVLFLSLALAVNLAVYGWLGALGAWSGKEVHRVENLVYLLIAGAFTALAAGAWYALAFVVSPFG
jgi:asparagine N-glycosylation enzyme membrane subunit Stt3